MTTEDFSSRAMAARTFSAVGPWSPVITSSLEARCAMFCGSTVIGPRSVSEATISGKMVARGATSDVRPVNAKVLEQSAETFLDEQCGFRRHGSSFRAVTAVWSNGPILPPCAE